ncbi:2TM domain-containing protein [Mangrovimonas yunxiaonensis]|uniref:2TM domain-containing protein n=1 Tax=Mangrovimonas yunxiaonensis TaxID=1197477 RepID=UPI00269D1C26
MAVVMAPNFSEQERLNRARKRVKQLKGLYMHALVYLVVNTFFWWLTSITHPRANPFFNGKILAQQCFGA